MKPKLTTITAEQVREILDYDAETGRFFWRARRSNQLKVGAQAGYLDADGYVRIGLFRSLFLAHRVAWLFAHQRWPEMQVDHINGIRCDNRIVNLREATPGQNSHNSGKRVHNTSGFKGVKRNGSKWSARIVLNYRVTWLGSFDTPEEAHAAYCAAAKQLHGDFAKT